MRSARIPSESDEPRLKEMNWFPIFQGLLTPIIGIIAVYIAFQQWRTNALKSKLDLFDRRFNVFLKVRRILSSVVPEGSAKEEEFLKFRSDVAEAYFVFGQEIEDYLDEIYRHGIGLATAHRLHRVPKEERPKDYDPRKIADQMDAELAWLMNQLPVVKAKFKRYLDVSKL